MKATLITLTSFGKQLFLSLAITCCAVQLNAQVTGTRTIGVDYPDLATAITDLNANGVSGAVIINVPAGYTETAPGGGYLLGSTTLNVSASVANTLTIRKNGTGANPLLTANTGTSTSVDGIFIIQGTDYVTIDGIDLSESVSNTTPTTRMEWGYALVKLQNTAPFDGCNNVTIQNCTVTLNRLNTPTVGIYAGNHIATTTTALTITATTDAMSNCRFYANTIRNSVMGISLRGFAAPTPYTLYDQDNDIGGSSTATGNTIQNYGGATSGEGVNLQYQNNANVSYNSIDNAAGGGISSTTILYGIRTQNGTNASVTITNNSLNLTQGTTGSAVYGINTSCAGTGTIQVNNNTLTANGGSTGTMYMIYFGGANTNITTNDNRFYDISVANSGSLYMIYHSTAATPAYITCNNNRTDGPSTPYINKTGSGGTVAGYYNNAGSGSGITTLNNNNFSHFTLAGSPTFYGIFENDGGTGQNKSARNNTVSNINSTGGTHYGISMGFSASEIFSENTVNFLNPGTGAAYGIYIGGSTNMDTVTNNRVHNLSSTNGNVYGIYVSSGSSVHVYLDTVYTLSTSGTTDFAYGLYQSGGTAVNIYRNKIYDVASTGTTGSAYGMYLNAGTTTVYNNLIGNMRTPNYSGAGGTQLAGIYTNGGVAHNIYYNSVYLNASSTGTAFGSAAIYCGTTPQVTLRNNIFVNLSTPVGAGLTVAYRRNGTSLTTYNAASNNNLFYAGTPGASRVIFYDGTTTYPTLTAFKTLVAPRDASSVTELPPFLATAGGSPDFLHLNPALPTQAEGGAINIAGITNDADNNIRAGNPGYTGSGSTPDIGAVEGEYTGADLIAPNISYAILSNGCSTGDRTFSAVISDATGVPVTGTQVPRVYFKKGTTGSWFSAAGTLASGTSISGTWNFTISAAALGGLATADTVFYFVIAEDEASTAHVGANPGAGLVATDVNTISTFPTAPNSYAILPVLSGTYNVGVGMAYTTITDAVNAYNTSCVSGNVVFQLMDATYPAETFPITINNNTSAGPANTLTIRPAAGVTPTISGSSASGIFVLNGADYVTIDGAGSPLTNSVCPAVVSPRDLTISNTSTSTTSAVIWIQTATGSDSATHNTIRNCNVAGSGNTRTLFAIGSGGTTISYTSSGTNNNSNRIENNRITATQTGIFTRGASATNKNRGTVINQNLLNGTTPDNLRNNGIFAGFEDGINISGNEITNITNSVSNDILGINLGFGNNATSSTTTTGSEVTNATVTHNKLDDLKQTNTYTCVGIAVAGATTGVNTIANNMISGVLSNGTSGDFSSGIFIGGAVGGTTRVYYNAVNMSGSLTGASYPSFAIAISGSNPIVELKNNIFVNTASTGSTRIYAIGLAYSTYSNLSSDNNNFYSVGPNMGTVNSLAGTGINQATLADWQTTTGGDASSHDVNPVFASASDLHIVPATENIPLMDAGIPVSVTNDFDCAIRSTTTPDIGLNEFSIPMCTSVTAGTAAPAIPAFCDSGSTTINLSGSTVGVGIVYQWQSSADSVSWAGIPGATASSYTTPVLGTTTFYRVVLVCGPTGLRDSATTKVTIHPLPAVMVTPAGGAICTDGTGLNMTASGAATYTWAPGTGLSTTVGAVVNANPSTTTDYVVTGTDAFGCVNTDTVTVSVTAAPDTFSVTPASSLMCEGATPVLLSATGAALPAAGPDSVASGTISVTVPDITPGGASTTLAISGIPAGATITEISVRFNITMTYDGDLTLNLTAPNGNTLNLVNRRGGSGDNFVNTVVSSAGSLLFTSSSAPFTNTFKADASMTAGTTALPVTTNQWADLYSIPSGTWTFSARDWGTGDIANITSWTLIINYTYNPSITWSPTAGLFTDAAGTIPYTGDTATNIYAQPSTTTTYTATLGLGACTNAATTIVNVNPLPDAGVITGPPAVCQGSTITLTDTVSGGVWTATNPRATVSSAGVVSGITPGIDTIMYIVTNTCGIDTAIKIISIDTLPVAGTVTGPSAVCVGSTITMVASAPGGVWSASNANATVSGTGVVTGVSGGTVTISYTVANGCDTVAATRNITVNPQPDAGTISGPTSVCEDATISLSSPAPGGVWISSNANATVTGTGDVTGVFAGVDTIWYVVTNACGADTATRVITIDPLPIAGLLIGAPEVCVGDSIVMSTTVSGGTWSSSMPYATVSSTGVVTGVSAGVTTISYSATNMCGTVAATKVVTVNPVPDAGTISGSTMVCTGQTITLTDAAPGGVWSSSNPSATVSGTGVVTGISTGTTIISYTVINSCGMDVAILPVVVNLSPTIFAITGGGTYCAGGAGMPVGVSSSEGGITYQLYNGTSPVGSPITGTGSAIDFGLQTAPGTYTVTGTNSTTGCFVTMTGTAVIMVNPTVPPTVSISASATTVCAGSAVTLTAIPVNGGATPTYQWQVNGVNTGTGIAYSYVPANGDVVKVTIRSSSCATPDTGSATVIMTVNPAAAPAVTITVSPGATVCSGTLATFTAHPVYGGTSPFIRWTKNGVNVATGPTYSYIPVNGDVVYCMLGSNYPCRLADTVLSNSITMTVVPPVTPVVTITARPGTTIAAGQADTLVASVSNGGPSPTYQWAINGVFIPGATNSFFISSSFANGDVVTCRVITSGPCGGVSVTGSVVITVVSVGVEEVNKIKGDVRLFPNPNSGVFTLKGTLPQTENEAYIEVTNMAGQIVYRRTVSLRNGAIEEQVTLGDNLANGMYLLNLTAGNEKIIFHFVLEQ